MSSLRGCLAALSGLAIVAAVVVGCSETITGTPQADPAQTGTPLSPQTTRSVPTIFEIPQSTTVPTRTTASPGPGTTGVAPAGDDTTCADYADMSDADKRAVLAVVGKGNPLITQNPDMWVTIVDTLCSVASPSAYIRDVVMGKL